ncbi:MAG: response regulator [Chloroflexota bacterium]
MSLCSSTKCVLLADNDPDVYDSACFLLEAAGYTIKAAQSLAEGKQLLKEEIIHAAVIDLRLTDNQHPEDISGFALGNELPDHIPFVIFTAYRDIDNLRHAMSEVGAKDVIDKNASDASEQLLYAVEKLFAEHVKPNFDLAIRGSVDPSEVAAQIELPHATGREKTARAETSRVATGDDICIILRTLFSTATRITVRYLFEEYANTMASHSGAVLLCVYPEYTNGHPGAPMVVKFSSRIKIAQEEENYENLMRYIGGTRLAVLDQSASSHHIGALSYRLLGQADPNGLRHFYDLFRDPKMDAKILGDKLVHFLREAFQIIYASAEEREVNLLTHYADCLNLSPTKLLVCSESVDIKWEDGQTYWPEVGFHLPDPISWVLAGEAWRGYPIKTKLCLCHGDLHSRNILVDSAMGFWLIDFERAIVSHCLRDFAELETDIKFQLSSFSGLEEYYQLETMLADESAFFPNPDTPLFDEPLPPAVDRAFQIIRGLRLLMKDRFPTAQKAIEYDLALLMSTLNVIRLHTTTRASQRLAYFSAGLLCKKIRNDMVHQ